MLLNTSSHAVNLIGRYVNIRDTTKKFKMEDENAKNTTRYKTH